MFNDLLKRLFTDPTPKERLLNILIATDQWLFNLACLGNASPDETASSCAWRSEQEGKILGKIFRPLIDTLLWFDKNHCEESYKAELCLRQLPKEIRNGYKRYSQQ